MGGAVDQRAAEASESLEASDRLAEAMEGGSGLLSGHLGEVEGDLDTVGEGRAQRLGDALLAPPDERPLADGRWRRHFSL